MLTVLGNSYQAVACDLDGTLLNKNHTISRSTLNFIRNLMDKVKLVLVSARPLRSVSQIAQEIGHCEVMVCANGSLVFNHEQKILMRRSIDHSMVKEIVQVCSKTPKVSYSVYSGEDWISPNIDVRIRNEADILGFNPIQAELPTEPIEKILLISDPNDNDEISKLLLPFKNRINISFSKGGYCEINAKNVDKASALGWIADRFNLPLNTWIAFGDGENDIPMIRSCGLGIAMGNAQNKLKEVSDLVIGTNDEEGIFHFLKEYAQV